MGVTFKENVSDIRNSKVVDIINELKSYGVKNIDAVDPFADAEEVMHEYGYKLSKEPSGKYDAIVVAVNHKQYLTLDAEYFNSLASDNSIFVDVKGVFRENRPNGLVYWSL
jgi:UDP-N-acetyl-D-galactosamine dehydrogenase